MADDFPYTKISKNLVVNVREIIDIGASKPLYKCVVADTFGATGSCILFSRKLYHSIESGALCVGKNIKITDSGKSLATHLNDSVKPKYKAQAGKQQIWVILKWTVLEKERNADKQPPAPAPAQTNSNFLIPAPRLGPPPPPPQQFKFDIPYKCTPAEIAEKRQQAIERLNKNKKKK